MKWRLKGLIQKTLSVVPGGLLVNDRMQRSIGTFRRFDVESSAKLDDFLLMVQQLREHGIAIASATFFEIGSGWYPTLPICLYLVGARKILTVDLTRHMKLDLALRLVQKLKASVVALSDATGADSDEIEDRRDAMARALGHGEDIGDASSGVIDYRAPADAAHTDLGSETVDVVFSNSVLEHIPPIVLDKIFAESSRILRPGGVVFHSVNCGDHYAYTDGSVGQLNYLQFSGRQWELLWNNDLQYQNRLRAKDFLDLARRHRFDIVRDTTKVLDERLAELRRLPRVADDFSGYTPEELCVTTVDFIGKKR